MIIENIQLHHVRMPFREPWETSSWRQTHKEGVVVCLRDAAGTIGWGESVADFPFYSYESVATSLHIMRDHIAPRILGREIPDIPAFLAAVAPITGHNMAKAGIEMALWDLIGQREGRSLQSLLGGSGGRVAVGVSVGIKDSPARLLEAVDRFLEEGYARVKLKIKKGRDVDHVAAVRARHPGLKLQVDGNAAYSIDDIAHLARLDAYDLLLLEQPFANDDIIDHARLKAAGVRTPICLDESIHSPADARKALDIQAAEIINIKPSRVGGLWQARAIHDLCRARGVPVWMGGMMESGIGRAANVAVASLPGFTLAGDISASLKYFFEDIIDTPFTLNRIDSTLMVPQGPGLGITVDLKALLRVTEHMEALRP